MFAGLGCYNPQTLYHTIAPCCYSDSSQNKKHHRYSTFDMSLGDGTSKQKCGIFCFCCMCERPLSACSFLKTYPFKLKFNFSLAKSKTKRLLHWMHTLSNAYMAYPSSISCSGQKQKHMVFLFLTRGCSQGIQSLAVFHVCWIRMLQSSDLVSHNCSMLLLRLKSK